MTTRSAASRIFPSDAFDEVPLSHARGTRVPCRAIGSAMARRGKGAIVDPTSVLHLAGTGWAPLDAVRGPNVGRCFPPCGLPSELMFFRIRVVDS